jgi:hypothetical protein
LLRERYGRGGIFVSILLARNIDINEFLRNVRIRLKGRRYELEIEPGIEDIPREREILEERRLPSAANPR